MLRRRKWAPLSAHTNVVKVELSLLSVPSPCRRTLPGNTCINGFLRAPGLADQAASAGQQELRGPVQVHSDWAQPPQSYVFDNPWLMGAGAKGKQRMSGAYCLKALDLWFQATSEGISITAALFHGDICRAALIQQAVNSLVWFITPYPGPF